jgi:hypothetical protein
MVVAGCGGGDAVQATQDGFAVQGGVVQKGPLLKGSHVWIDELNPLTYAPAGFTYNLLTKDNKGSFNSSAINFTRRHIQTFAEGYYFNEITGAMANDSVLLQAQGDLIVDRLVNVNLLTTLAGPRLVALLTDKTKPATYRNFDAARTQAQKEVLAAFLIYNSSDLMPGGVDTNKKLVPANFSELDLAGTHSANQILAALSALSVKVGVNGVGISQFIANFQQDLTDDGLINGTNGAVSVRSSIETASATADMMAGVANNLNTFYGANTITAAQLSQWVDSSGGTDQVIDKYKFSAANIPVGVESKSPAYIAGTDDVGQCISVGNITSGASAKLYYKGSATAVVGTQKVVLGDSMVIGLNAATAGSFAGFIQRSAPAANGTCPKTVPTTGLVRLSKYSTKVAPTVSISANPMSVAAGSASSLTWSSINATSCTASGGWSGTKATSGSNQTTGALTAASNTTFQLTCSDAAGRSNSATVTVSVSGGGGGGGGSVALGEPSASIINGLALIRDTLHHTPKTAVDATLGTFPPKLANAAMSTIPNIKVLNRRDAAIIYVPNVAGAADYRAYIYDSTKVTFAGAQPRGAVVACAGYRQRYVRGFDSLGRNYPVPAVTKRELMQAIEVPGLVLDGNYNIIVEALATPCPFPGILAHTSATLPLSDVAGGGTFSYYSFSEMLSTYGNEILNGQASSLTDYKVIAPIKPRPYPVRPAEPVGLPVRFNSTVAPADPTVIARSVITVTRPAADEAVNAPIFDVGPNSHWDDFSTNAIMTTLRPPVGAGKRAEGAGHVSEGKFGDWFFWTIGLQPAYQSGSSGPVESGNNPKSAQVWSRHGRLYNTFADWSQDIWGSMMFSSTKSRPQKLDTTKYVHSFFRVDSSATQRRYWQWTMCGGATQAELVDMTTGIPLARPVGQPHFYDFWEGSAISGKNPSRAMTELGETQQPWHNKECLTLLQIGDYYKNSPSGAASSWFDEPHSALRVFIHPAGTAKGTINLKPAGIVDNYADGEGGMYWRLDASKKPLQPMFEPFDQLAPLSHYDMFVRSDRIIFYINGRQAWCGDLSDRPLTMKYGYISYGSLLYHSSAAIETEYVGVEGYPGQPVGGNFHTVMNTPWANVSTWDAVGHSENLDIPSQFTFDPARCHKPKSMVTK